MTSTLDGHVVVVSPHCDDAVLSLGAVLAAHTRRGGTATVLTVLAGDPDADEAPGPWDAAAGFCSAGQATRARRAEDLAACARVGADAVHLDDVDEQYARRLSDDALWERARPVLDGADEVLLPGHPLTHPDHRAVLTLMLARLLPERPVRLYAEQPYARWQGGGAPAGHPLAEAVRWHGVPAERRDALRAVRALAAYRSQLPLLGAPSRRRGLPPTFALLLQAWRGLRPHGELLSDPVPAGALLAEVS